MSIMVLFSSIKGGYILFADFSFAVYRMVLQAGEQGLNLPPYKGSTLRGGFGHVFRRICCSQPQAECLTCLLAQACPYAQIFEPAPPPGSAVLKNYSDIPRPFVIEPPLETKTYYAPGEQLSFNLILIGQAVQYLPYFILAFKELGNVGIGKGRKPFVLADILAIDSVTREEASIYNSQTNAIAPVRNTATLADLLTPKLLAGEQLTINFVTMTRIKYDSLLVKDIPFHVLIRNLLRRISTLHYFYNGRQIADIDYKGLIAEAEKIQTVSSDLSIVDWERYSHRQDVKMNMGGMVGTVTYKGDMHHFAPLIRLGEMVHVGKGCVFGLGKYAVE